MTCDYSVDAVYFDGVKQNLPADQAQDWEKITYVEVPEATRVMAFHCSEEGLGAHGLIAKLEVSMWTGDRAVYTVTDTDWTCSGVAESEWETLDFKETSNWKPAVVTHNAQLDDLGHNRWIWNSYERSETYCRKNIDMRPFMSGMLWKLIVYCSNGCNLGSLKSSVTVTADLSLSIISYGFWILSARCCKYQSDFKM